MPKKYEVPKFIQEKISFAPSNEIYENCCETAATASLMAWWQGKPS